MYPTPFTTPGVKAFAEAIDQERQAQLRKFGEQHHPDGTGLAGDREQADQARNICQATAEDGTVAWRHILLEEVAEVLAESDPVALRTELLQVAAVCAAWIHDLDSRQALGTTDAPEHKHAWVTALDGDDRPARDESGQTWTHCGICGQKRGAAVTEEQPATSAQQISVDDLARLLHAANVHVNNGDYPAWDDLSTTPGLGQDEVRKAARYILARCSVTPTAPAAAETQQ